MTTPQRTVAGIVEELRQVASILAGLQAQLPADLHISLDFVHREGDDAEAVRVVDLLAVYLLGRKAGTAGDYHSASGTRNGLYLHIQAKLAGPQKTREAALEAENARLRAQLAEAQTGRPILRLPDPEGGDVT